MASAMSTNATDARRTSAATEPRTAVGGGDRSVVASRYRKAYSWPSSATKNTVPSGPIAGDELMRPCALNL